MGMLKMWRFPHFFPDYATLRTGLFSEHLALRLGREHPFKRRRFFSNKNFQPRGLLLPFLACGMWIYVINPMLGVCIPIIRIPVIFRVE